LKENRTYTPQMRALARKLVQYGCAREKIGGIIKSVSNLFGIQVKNEMSRRTVGRAVLEGWVAAQVQLGYELSLIPTTTLSQDSTGHKHQNIEVEHLAIHTPDYRTQTSVLSEQPKLRILSIAPTLDHSADESKMAWLKNFSTIISTYTQSPLFKREGISLTIQKIAKKIKGMNGDHANNEKVTANHIQKWKHEMAIEELGEEKMLEMDIMHLFGVLRDTHDRKIAKAGGPEAWNNLSRVEQAALDAAVMKELKLELGQELYDGLDESLRRTIDQFFWTGCCMHKDQNSFKAGNAHMMAFWDKHGLEGPIVLANKHNAPTLEPVLNPNAQRGRKLTDAEVAALEASTRGGAKTAAIAGAVLRNRDERKGQGKVYIAHFRDLLEDDFEQFPDTSNTRFASHGAAAGVLFLHDKHYIDFLETVKLTKNQPGWTNIEKNLVNALKCPQTRQELAVLGLVHQAITVPYLRVVRKSSSVNALDLGPWHEQVREHMQKLIDNPALLLTPGEDTYLLASLDGRPWEKPDVVKAVHSRLQELPYIQDLLIEFLTGALATYIRFTAEFAPGSLIDLATQQEKDDAWMPATNDVNEGALGSYRVMMRFKPTLTIQQYNAMVLYARNDTQAFMDAKFTNEDFRYIMREARVLDASGMEAKRRKEQVEFNKRVVALKKAKQQAKDSKERERKERLSKVVLLREADEVNSTLTVAALDDQLDVLR
ncbi:hypothetical protein K435DRAFT_596010, partial [Dendrothele bispora CBS 962.96]